MPMESTVNITARAANRICEITAGENQPHSLRISVNGGGCSGFQYDFAMPRIATMMTWRLRRMGPRFSLILCR